MFYKVFIFSMENERRFQRIWAKSEICSEFRAFSIFHRGFFFFFKSESPASEAVNESASGTQTAADVKPFTFLHRVCCIF